MKKQFSDLRVEFKKLNDEIMPSNITKKSNILKIRLNIFNTGYNIIVDTASNLNIVYLST